METLSVEVRLVKPAEKNATKPPDLRGKIFSFTFKQLSAFIMGP